jgi:hypothetical protein
MYPDESYEKALAEIGLRPKVIAPGETSEVPTRRRRGDRIVRNGQILEFIEEEIEGEKWRVIGPAPNNDA